ncbi:MAG: HAD family hydrolase [Ruminococcaceae bacterium]|nr:HAD family hydrolase [Oscillospiraceae bacterium]
MGLTAAQVESRNESGHVNVSVDKTSKSVAQIILGNVFTYFNMIFFILAALLIVEKSYEHLTFLVVVFFNTVIGIVQEIRAKQTLEKLSLVSAPLVKVIRDGREDLIGSDELVLDDIVIFEAGNQICADAIVCDGTISANEALVTGESDEIKKESGDELLSGSFVVSGRCRARLNRVGHESFASKLTIDAKKIKKKQQPGMMKSLTLLIKIIGIIIIPLSIIMFINQHQILGHSVKESVENTAASVIGMIPEGLYLLTTIALAVSVIRLAQKKTLVHDMKCIETLARVDVICVDKTGTVTEPDMHVKGIVPLENEEGDDYYNIERQIRDFVLNMNADNITMTALREHFDDKKGYRKATEIKGFSSATKYSAASFGAGKGYLLGAPEFILRRDFAQFREVIDEHSSLGERVLLFAEYQYDPHSSEDIFNGGSLDGVVIPVALVTLINRIRPEAKETFEYFASQGVTIKVISGDNPLTASKAAEQAGIVGSEKYVDATLLTSKEKIAKAVEEYTVFGRVTPEQKRQFVRALKSAGHTVAMTGDGVNDVLALKDADCSIAMASGSDAAASVSDLVLLDSNFACMPSVVAEGRRVINNIQRSASLYLVKNVFSFILTLITIIAVVPYPLNPAQISLVSYFFIGIPSFFLALEPNHEIVKGKFLRNVLFKAFPAALSAVIVVSWSMLFAYAFSPVLSTAEASTIAIFLYSFVAYLMLFRICRPLTLIHKLLVGSMGVLFLLGSFCLPHMFGLSKLDLGSILVLMVLMLIAYPIDNAIQRLFNNFGWFKKKAKDILLHDMEKQKTDS